jgi:FecR protein
MEKHLWRFVILALTLGLLPIAALRAQQTPAGVVTTLQGTAERTRPTQPLPTTLRFKDDIFVRDVINTKEKSLARVLFGGKSTITVRELSRLEVREEAIPGGGTRSIHELTSGAILVNVAKQLMGPGDEVQIRTPNAVASIRGTIVYCECHGRDVNTACNFATLTGSMTLTPNGVTPRSLSGSSSGAESVTVTGDSPANIQVSPTAIMPMSQVAQVMESFEGPLGPPNQPQNAAAQLQQAANLANAVVAAVTSGTTSNNPLVQNAALTLQNTNSLTDNITQPQSNPGPTTAPLSPLNSCGANCVSAITTGTDTSTGTMPPPVSVPPKTGNGIPPLWESNYGTPVAAFQGCDDCGTVLQIPFNFSFRGNSFNQINLSSNGFLFLGTAPGGSTGDFTPSVAEFLSGPARVALMWADFFTPGGGSINYNNSFSDHVVITWDGVPFFPFNSPRNTVQMQLYSNGQIIFSYMTLNPLVTSASNTALIGITPGNGARDPGAVNFASAISFNTGSQGTVYELFQGQGTQFGLDGMSFIFTPNGNGGWDVMIDDVDAFLSIVKGDVVNHLGTAPFIDFNHISLNIGGHFYNQSGGVVTLGGPLLNAVDNSMTIGSDPSTPGDLVNVRGGGQLVVNRDAPLIQLSGGTLTVGTRDTTAKDSPNHLIYIGGANADPTSGVGSDRPIRGSGANQSVGMLLNATHGSTIEVLKGSGDTSGGNAVKLDMALLDATLPVINLVGSPTAYTSLTTDSSTIELIKSQIVSLGPVIAMDKGLINVNNGPLFNITSGSQLVTAGDLLRLTNGSRINVFNGPLISVSGTGSLLAVNGALVNFAGTGGNKIVVNNSLIPTAILSGLPVSATNGGNISIGPNPVSNPNGGKISVSGSLIQATNNGQVNIKGR